MVSTRRTNFDSEDDCEGRGRTWEPLLNPQSSQPSASTKGDGRGSQSDIWSSRIREKVFFFLNSNLKLIIYNLMTSLYDISSSECRCYLFIFSMFPFF